MQQRPMIRCADQRLRQIPHPQLEKRFPLVAVRSAREQRLTSSAHPVRPTRHLHGEGSRVEGHTAEIYPPIDVLQSVSLLIAHHPVVEQYCAATLAHITQGTAARRRAASRSAS
jgi:hypothetical protein